MAPAHPIIAAHRGVHAAAGENSLDAFVAAVTAKIPWVECDVWLSADGIPVVIHDETLDRTTAGTGLVSDHTWPQLQQLGVPSFTQVLDALGGAAGIMVEIKPPAAIPLVTQVRHALQHFSAPWMIQSFHFENIDASRQCAALVEEPSQMQTALAGSYHSIHADHVMIDRVLVDQLRNQGRKIGAWTVNTPADIERMLDLGVDALITDEPELARQLIEKRSWK